LSYKENNPMSKPTIFVLALFALLASIAVIAGPVAASEGPFARQVAAVRAATAKYHNVNVAIADGYLPTQQCVESPAGGMGYHFFNPTLGSDLASDSLKPELLIYAPSGNGGLKLVAVEYFQANAGQGRPSILGQPFEGPMAGHEPGMPEHYDLHFWIWQPNPDGLFADWNPSVTCARAN
jgi:hypothetical protein